MGFIIKPDSSKTELKPKDGKTFSLEEMQAAVGGMIEHVPQDDFTGTVWCDEEGRIKNPPKRLNRAATILCYPNGVRDGYELVGDVLFCEPGEVE